MPITGGNRRSSDHEDQDHEDQDHEVVMRATGGKFSLQ